MFEPYLHLFSIEAIAFENREANDPYEPFKGVGALFNADLHTTEPAWAPREHWEVISPFRIAHKSVDEIIRLGQAESE